MIRLCLYLEFDDSGQLSTNIYDKIINFPNMCSNIPASPAYGVFISQLIPYARASSNYSDFLKRHLQLRNRLLDQGYKKIRVSRSLKKFIFRYQYLVEIYSVFLGGLILIQIQSWIQFKFKRNQSCQACRKYHSLELFNIWFKTDHYMWHTDI